MAYLLFSGATIKAMILKRILLALLIIIVTLFILAFLFISPIAKYVIEKNSEKYIGRKVKIEHLWINLFAGSVKISGFKLFENKSDKVFLSCNRFYISMNVKK